MTEKKTESIVPVMTVTGPNGKTRYVIHDGQGVPCMTRTYRTKEKAEKAYQDKTYNIPLEHHTR